MNHHGGAAGLRADRGVGAGEDHVDGGAGRPGGGREGEVVAGDRNLAAEARRRDAQLAQLLEAVAVGIGGGDRDVQGLALDHAVRAGVGKGGRAVAVVAQHAVVAHVGDEQSTAGAVEGDRPGGAQRAIGRLAARRAGWRVVGGVRYEVRLADDEGGARHAGEGRILRRGIGGHRRGEVEHAVVEHVGDPQAARGVHGDAIGVVEAVGVRDDGARHPPRVGAAEVGLAHHAVGCGGGEIVAVGILVMLSDIYN